jgi:F-type H+-transporting ATPase subunit b
VWHLVAAASSGSEDPLLPSLTELILGGIAFLIVFIALGKVLLPRIQKTLDERTDAIEGGLHKAEQAQHEAAQTLAAYREQLAEARHEAARLREQAREEGAAILAEMKVQAAAEARRLVAAAHTQIEADRAQAMATLRAEVGALAVELAGRVVGESLTEEARQRRTVDRFLAELGHQPEAATRG